MEDQIVPGCAVRVVLVNGATLEDCGNQEFVVAGMDDGCWQLWSAEGQLFYVHTFAFMERVRDAEAQRAADERERKRQKEFWAERERAKAKSD